MKLDNLLALQDEDTRLRNLQRELTVLLPARRKDAKARLAYAQNATKIAEQENLSALREYERFQSDYTRQRDNMNRAERNAGYSSSLKAQEAAAAEYAAAERAANAAAEAAGRIAENRTPTERRLDAARAFEASEDIAVANILASLDERKVQIEAEMANIQVRRDALVAAVDPKHLHYYDRVRKTCWPAAVQFNRNDSVCSGCNLVQPASVKQAVLAAEKTDYTTLVHCPSCGRILL
jgi:predicted  nucleic acid-binding Zn-ribbon protein